MKPLIYLLLIIQILSCSDFDNFYQGKRVGVKNLTGSSLAVARIGKDWITKQDLVESLDDLPTQQRTDYLSSPETLKEYLDSLIDQQVLYKEAKKSGIDKRNDVKENIQNYEKRLLIQTLSQDILERQISEEELKKYYEENQIEFSKIRISEILIKANSEQGISKEAARTIALLVVNRAKQGESFEELVEYFSDDTASKKRGGDFGFILKKNLPDSDIGNKIFNLKVGEISDPLETEGGFLIVKVTENPQIVPFYQVRDQIQVELRKKAFSDYTKKLREQFGVEVFESNLKKISQNG